MAGAAFWFSRLLLSSPPPRMFRAPSLSGSAAVAGTPLRSAFAFFDPLPFGAVGAGSAGGAGNGGKAPSVLRTATLLRKSVRYVDTVLMLVVMPDAVSSS